MATFFAHTADPGKPWEPLAVHLARVAGRAAGHASAWGGEEEARAAGLLHDLGKYSELFQRRLEGKERGLDHWSNGAWAALQRYQLEGVAAALAIAGHHVGLGQGNKDGLGRLEPRRLLERHPQELRLTEGDYPALLRRLEADGLTLPAAFRSRGQYTGPSLPFSLEVRMLFSALVDADFVETEAHFEGGPDGAPRYRAEGPALEPERALALLERELARLGAQGRGRPEVQALRAELAAACFAAAESAPGLFTLTAPTGSGKTLALLAFALEHARRHSLRRLVLASPYLTLIEQTAGVYRRLLEAEFGPHYVLEHHSLAQGGAESEAQGAEPEEAGRAAARRLAENWDAPLVLTTNVQLLESLFAARPGRCRKLHRLARSVVVFDEAQALPPRLAVPTLATLSYLAESFGSTVVFATATQPAFEHLGEPVRQLVAAGWAPREVVPAAAGLFGRVRRVHFVWRTERPTGWGELARELAERPQVLCIVNLKRHARELVARLRGLGAEGVLHVSTNLCPAHRQKVLAEVRRRLENGEPCRLVATQCVEAGVDLDFPVAYRALAPLEAIAQAAGRCNRNGRLAELGEVVVFRPAAEEGELLYPPGEYAQAASATEALLTAAGPAGLDLEDPETFRRYFRAFYELSKCTENWQKLHEALQALDFEALAREYRLIEQDAINVLVPYDIAEFERLRGEVAARGWLTAELRRRLQPHVVSLYRPKQGKDVWQVLEPLPAGRGEASEEWFVLVRPEAYDPELLGFLELEASWIA